MMLICIIRKLTNKCVYNNIGVDIPFQIKINTSGLRDVGWMSRSGAFLYLYGKYKLGNWKAFCYLLSNQGISIKMI